ncbi:MAG: apolipoprotein N-acyltransferase [Desulfobacterales bacterium]|nr:apolipoprotein N-acyltransferase [Desulfobacterales bacterium]
MDKKNWFWAILSGVLLTAAFPKVGLWQVGWFALVPLLVAVKDLTFGQAFRVGFAAGLAHFLTLLYWLLYTMQNYGGLPFYLAVPVLFLLSAYMAVYIGIFASLMPRWTKSLSWGCLAAIPLFWVSLEYIRGFLFTGFPWSFLGYSQHNQLHIIQISDIFGVYGVSFLMALSNAAFFLVLEIILIQKPSENENRTIPFRAVRILSVFIVLLAAAWIYGKWQVSSFDHKLSKADVRRITVVQGNIDQAIKWDPAFQIETTEKYINLSLSAEKHDPDMVVWPETATPFYFLGDVTLSKMVIDAVASMQKDFLIGSPSYSYEKGKEDIDYYNSAYLIGAEPKVLGKYDKVHLVPFGEYIPFKKWLPFLGKMVAHVGDFKSGKKGDTLLWKDEKLGIQICFEIIFPGLSRAMVKNGAGILINITNDAWFARTSAPYQHFSMAVFRAVENRRSLVRAANTGISGFVDPVGRVLSRSELFETAVLTKNIPIYHETSLYTRLGDLFAVVCTLLSVIFILTGLIKAKGISKT